MSPGSRRRFKWESLRTKVYTDVSLGVHNQGGERKGHPLSVKAHSELVDFLDSHNPTRLKTLPEQTTIAKLSSGHRVAITLTKDPNGGWHPLGVLSVHSPRKKLPVVFLVATQPHSIKQLKFNFPRSPLARSEIKKRRKSKYRLLEPDVIHKTAERVIGKGAAKKLLEGLKKSDINNLRNPEMGTIKLPKKKSREREAKLSLDSDRRFLVVRIKEGSVPLWDSMFAVGHGRLIHSQVKKVHKDLSRAQNLPVTTRQKAHDILDAIRLDSKLIPLTAPLSTDLPNDRRLLARRIVAGSPEGKSAQNIHIQIHDGSRWRQVHTFYIPIEKIK